MGVCVCVCVDNPLANIYLSIANDGCHCCSFELQSSESTYRRLLVNPGNSVAIAWLEWERGKNENSFPDNVVPARVANLW